MAGVSAGGRWLTRWLLSPYFLQRDDEISNAEVRHAPPILFIAAALASSTFQLRSPREMAWCQLLARQQLTTEGLTRSNELSASSYALRPYASIPAR